MREHLGDTTTSTNAALLPMAAPMGDNQTVVARKTGNNTTNNNGFLWRSNSSSSNNNNSPRDDKSPALPILLAEDTERSATTDDVVMTELGSSTRVDVRGISKRGSTNLRQYRCQLIFVLIAFIEFGLLIAGLTFYLSGVLTATCDHNRQGKANR